MRAIENTLTVEVETWDDPGVYPSNAGGYPRRSFDYVTGDGYIVAEFEDDETINDIEDCIGEWVEYSSGAEIPRRCVMRYTIEDIGDNKIKIIPDFESSYLYS
jgi:hypothetical protein